MCVKKVRNEILYIVGLQSPSARTRAAEPGNLLRSQTIGQRIMGNMMDNIFVRSLTSKSKGRASDVSVPSSPIKVLYLNIFLEVVYDLFVIYLIAYVG